MTLRVAAAVALTSTSLALTAVRDGRDVKAQVLLPHIKLPYTAAQSYGLTQGNNGAFTHCVGKPTCIAGERYAFDFGLHDGDVIVAAHDGTVRAVVDTYPTGGCARRFLNSANYVVIDHGDGTSALYLHITQGSASTVVNGNQSKLVPGLAVKQGQEIALADASGYACPDGASHLHFQVQNTCATYHCQSIPVYFDDLNLAGEKLVEATSYRSGNTKPIPPAPPPPDWRNTSYTMNCDVNAPQPFTVDVKNGQGVAAKLGDYDRYEVSVDAVATGDLTGDGSPEAAVFLSCSPQPSNFSVNELEVFTSGQRMLAELNPPSIPPDGPLAPLFDSQEFSIADGKLVTGTHYYAVGDTHAGGPSIHRTLAWHWNGQKFDFSIESESGPRCQQGASAIQVGSVCLPLPPGYDVQRQDQNSAVVRNCGNPLSCVGFDVFVQQAYDAERAVGDGKNAFLKDDNWGWSTATDRPLCYGGSVAMDSKLAVSGVRPFGPKTAEYREWTLTCQDGTSQKVRAWILPSSKVLVLQAPQPQDFPDNASRAVQTAVFS